MSLRPRYSLLTLLVLTALVAGGALWWRASFRVVLLYPDPAIYSPHQPTPDQEALLRRMPLHPSSCSNLTLEYVIEYEATREGRKLSVICGRAHAPLDLIYSRSPKSRWLKSWAIVKHRPRHYQIEPWTPQKIEQVHCWVFAHLNSAPLKYEYQSHYDSMQFYWPELGLGEDPMPVYLLTKSGLIFDLQCPKDVDHQLRPLTLASIPPSHARFVLERELGFLRIKS